MATKRQRGLYGLLKDIRKVSAYNAKCIIDKMPEFNKEVSANIGNLVAAAMSAAGVLPEYIGCGSPCETDYLAASGAVFPKVSVEQMNDFNAKTMFENMDEKDEEKRYMMIAEFFHGRAAV